MLGQLGELENASRLLERAIALASQVGDPFTEGIALESLGWMLAQQERAEVGWEKLEEGGARLREVGDPTQLGKLLCKRGEIEILLGDLESTQRHLEEGQAIASQLGLGDDTELVIAARELAERLRSKPPS